MKIDPNMTAPGVSVTGDALTIDDLELDGIAKALADDLKQAVIAAGWVKSGELLRGIRADGGAVTVPAGHLSRDPELAKRFAAEVMPSDPLADRGVQAAAEKAVHEAIGKNKP